MRDDLAQKMIIAVATGVAMAGRFGEAVDERPLKQKGQVYKTGLL
jgi:hypothetical protein